MQLDTSLSSSDRIAQHFSVLCSCSEAAELKPRAAASALVGESALLPAAASHTSRWTCRSLNCGAAHAGFCFRLKPSPAPPPGTLGRPLGTRDGQQHHGRQRRLPRQRRRRRRRAAWSSPSPPAASAVARPDPALQHILCWADVPLWQRLHLRPRCASAGWGTPSRAWRLHATPHTPACLPIFSSNPTGEAELAAPWTLLDPDQPEMRSAAGRASLAEWVKPQLEAALAKVGAGGSWRGACRSLRQAAGHRSA